MKKLLLLAAAALFCTAAQAQNADAEQ